MTGSSGPRSCLWPHHSLVDSGGSCPPRASLLNLTVHPHLPSFARDRPLLSLQGTALMAPPPNLPGCLWAGSLLCSLCGLPGPARGTWRPGGKGSLHRTQGRQPALCPAPGECALVSGSPRTPRRDNPHTTRATSANASDVHTVRGIQNPKQSPESWLCGHDLGLEPCHHQTVRS